MTSNISYPREYLVYPCESTLMPEIEALLEEANIQPDDAAKPLVNMDEFNNCFKIEMVVPGVNREDILIHAQDNVLYVTVLHKEDNKLKEELKIHEFETECLQRHISLPGNTDPEFASAEYRQGILSLYIPKTLKPSKSVNNHIIVY